MQTTGAPIVAVLARLAAASRSAASSRGNRPHDLRSHRPAALVTVQITQICTVIGL